MKSITERLLRLGYTHSPDSLSKMDNRHSIYANGMSGYAIDRMDAKEAAEFCNREEILDKGNTI